MAVLAQVLAAVERWKEVAMSAEVGLQSSEMADFRPAFEHVALAEAKALLA